MIFRRKMFSRCDLGISSVWSICPIYSTEKTKYGNLKSGYPLTDRAKYVPSPMCAVQFTFSYLHGSRGSINSTKTRAYINNVVPTVLKMAQELQKSFFLKYSSPYPEVRAYIYIYSPVSFYNSFNSYYITKTFIDVPRSLCDVVWLESRFTFYLFLFDFYYIPQWLIISIISFLRIHV